MFKYRSLRGGKHEPEICKQGQRKPRKAKTCKGRNGVAMPANLEKKVLRPLPFIKIHDLFTICTIAYLSNSGGIKKYIPLAQIAENRAGSSPLRLPTRIGILVKIPVPHCVVKQGLGLLIHCSSSLHFELPQLRLSSMDRFIQWWQTVMHTF